MRAFFTDEQGRQWNLLLTYATMQRFRAAGLDPFRFFCDETCDLETLVRILWVWLEPQLDERGVNESQFAECLNGEALASAYREAREQAHDFLSHMNPPRAAAMRKAIEAADLLVSKATTEVGKISLTELSHSASA